MQKKVNTITADNKDVEVDTGADSCIPTEDHYLCFVASEKTILAYSKVAVMASFRGPRLVMIDPHQNVVERRCFMITPAVMNILQSKPFYVYIANVTAGRLDLPEHLVVASASNAWSCILHKRDDESCSTETKVRPQQKANQITRYEPFTTNCWSVGMNKWMSIMQ